MRKVLIGIDGSENALKAVDYVGRQFCGEDVRIILFHVLPFVPTEFWDDGHILSEEEKQARKSVIEKWLSNRKLILEPIFENAKKVLAAYGIAENRVNVKWISDSTDTAGSIIEEAKSGDYQTLVIGRRGHGNTRNRLGAVADKLVRHGAGVPLSLVE